MKKYLFLVSVAAVALTACTNESEEYVGSNQAREISFSPIAQKHTRAAVLDGTFPTSNTMEVAAYQSAPTSGDPATGKSYFTKTTFSKGTSNWGGGKYWPTGVATLNFFAVSGSGVNASDITINNDLTSASVAYTTAKSYSNTTQSDIMYAFNRGSVTLSSGTFSYNGGSAVAMQFKHALSLVSFTVKAKDEASTAITINSITLKGASYTGTLTLTNDAPVNASSGTVTTTVAWTADKTVSEVTVPNVPSSLTTTAAAPSAGNACLMIIPKASAFTSFVINYSLNGVAYNYEYTPSSAVTAAEGTKYTYNIEFGSNEILIAPTVSTWSDGGTSSIEVK